MASSRWSHRLPGAQRMDNCGRRGWRFWQDRTRLQQTGRWGRASQDPTGTSMSKDLEEGKAGRMRYWGADKDGGGRQPWGHRGEILSQSTTRKKKSTTRTRARTSRAFQAVMIEEWALTQPLGLNVSRGWGSRDCKLLSTWGTKPPVTEMEESGRDGVREKQWIQF